MSKEEESKLEAESSEPDAGYNVPKERTLAEIVSADAEDEALNKYKASLLGSSATSKEPLVVDASNPSNVIVVKLSLLAEERDEESLDLTDLNALKSKKFVLKEGVAYRIRIDFYVQREIVTGLKYVQKTSRLHVPVDKMNVMVGSYAPKKELQSFTTNVDHAPSGITGRGVYHVHSCFTDDDNKDYLKWDWTIDIKKDWND